MPISIPPAWPYAPILYALGLALAALILLTDAWDAARPADSGEASVSGTERLFGMLVRLGACYAVVVALRATEPAQVVVALVWGMPW